MDHYIIKITQCYLCKNYFDLKCAGVSNADFNSGNNNVEWACHDCYHITFPFHSIDHSNLFKLNSFNVKYSLHLVPTDNFKKNVLFVKKI